MDAFSATSRDGDPLRLAEICAELAEYFGVRHAVVVDHGTTAVRAACWALRLLAPDACSVAAPCNVWRGVYSAAAAAGYPLVRIVDVDPISGVLASPGARDEVVIAVDGYGVAPPVRELKDRGMGVVHDASLNQRPVMHRGRMVADVCAISLQGNKLLSCGEGGVVLTDKDDIAEIVETLVCDGRRWRSGVEPDPVRFGFNGMMALPLAELLIAQTQRAAAYTSRVAAGIAHLADALSRAGHRALGDAVRTAPASFAVQLPAQVKAELDALGIQSGTPPPGLDHRHRQLLASAPIPTQVLADYPDADRFAESVIVVPHWQLTRL